MNHRLAGSEISFQLYRDFRERHGVPFFEVDVMPFATGKDALSEITTVVQPNLIIVCEESKITEYGCMGAPDLVLEIRSSDSTDADKTKIYEAAGVPEFWLLDIDRKELTVCVLKNGRFTRKVYSGPVKVPVTVLDGYEVDMEAVYRKSERG